MASILRPRLFITNQIPLQFIRSLERVFELDYQDVPTPLSQDQVLSRIRAQPPDAMFIAGKVIIDKELLSVAGDKLKMLATLSVGYDHIDVKECKKRGVSIGYTPGRIK
jgi:glyoxylate/hydroxypyruvate reductase